MPDLGEGLEDGRIVEWLVAEGAEVALNQPLVEVETAKAAVEIPSPFAGRIVTLHGAIDADVPVGAPLITFDVAGDGAAVPQTGATAGPRATPPVRKLAKELGVDLAFINATGPDGRITEDDVRRGSTRSGATSGPDSSRRQLAAALTRQAAIPQVTTFRTVDCTALEPFRAELGVSPLPIFIAALVRTVADHPILNAAWTDDGTSPRDDVHVAIAVDTEHGLVAPVIHDAPRRTIAELRGEIERLAASTRDGHLRPDDLAARNDRGEQHRLVRLRGGHADPVAGHERHARARCDRATRPRRGRPGGGAPRRHDLDDLRPSRVGRRRRRARPIRSRGAARVGRTAGRAASVKIASLLPSATEIVYALGLGDDLVGVTDECDYPPAAVTKPVVSRSALSQGHLQTPREIDNAVRDKVGAGEPIYQLDVDLLRRTQPDVLLTQDLCRVCAVPSGQVQEALDKIGLPDAKVLSLDPNTLDEVIATIGVVAKLLEREEKGEEIVAALQQRVAIVKEKAKRLPTIGVFALEWSDPPFSAGHWIPGMITAVGGTPVLADDGMPSRETAWHEVRNAMPEVIVFMPCGYYLEEAEEEAGAFLSQPEFADTPAVRNGNVYAVDATSFFSRPGPRLVDGLEILAWAAHPDSYPAPPAGTIAKLG